MDALFAWLVVVFFVCALLYLRELRKRRAREKKEGSLSGIHWAEQHYTDPEARSVAARFVTILESQIHVPLDRYAPTTRFLEDLGMDDLEPVEVLLALEEDFHTKIPDEDARRMLVIDDMIQYLTKLKGSPNQTPDRTRLARPEISGSTPQA